MLMPRIIPLLTLTLVHTQYEESNPQVVQAMHGLEGALGSKEAPNLFGMSKCMRLQSSSYVTIFLNSGRLLG